MTVDLDEVLGDVRDDLQVKIGENDAVITAEELPRVVGDGGQLRQLFRNLLDNAIGVSEQPEGRDVECPSCNTRTTAVVPRNSEIVDREDADRTSWVNCLTCGERFLIYYRTDR